LLAVSVDGFAKSPTSLLRFIPSFFNVRQVRLIAEDSRASNLKLFTLPSKFDFLRGHQRLALKNQGIRFFSNKT